MDLKTTQRDVHDGRAGRRPDAKIPESDLGDRPMLKSSTYENTYPNWRNGNHDTYIEKHPQFPVYTLPFKSDSSYKHEFTADQLDKIRNQTIRVQKGHHKIT